MNAQFCSSCKILLFVEECDRCGNINEYNTQPVIIEKAYTGSKHWISDELKVKQASLNMNCPNCNYRKVYYTSKQMRSADEGETVFIECKKCGYKTVAS